MRQLGKHFIISWTLIGLITVTLYNRQYISTQVWVMDPITLPSILQCWLNAAEAKGHLHLLLQALCLMCSLRGTCVASAHMLNLNQPLISQSVRHWAVPVSYGPFRQQCPWGTWVSVLMTCHTIFITVTCSFMAPAHRSEPAEGWAIRPVPLLAAPPLWLFITSISASWLFSSSHRAVFVFHPRFLSVLVISLTPCSDPLHPRHHWLPTTSLPLSLPGGGGATLEWLILPQTELNMEEREMGAKLWLTL